MGLIFVVVGLITGTGVSSVRVSWWACRVLQPLAATRRPSGICPHYRVRSGAAYPV
jgi:hypothetical protein